MNSSLQTPFVNRLSALVAVMVGVAIPLRASGVAPQQGALGLALIAAMFLYTQNAGIREEFKRAIVSSVAKWIAVLMGIWALTALSSPEVLKSLKIGLRTGLFLLTVLLIWAVLIVHKNQQKLLWKALIICAVFFTGLSVIILGGLYEMVSVLKGNGWVRVHPHVLLKAFAASALCLIPVVAWAGRRLGGLWQWVGYGFAPLVLAVIIQTSNRAALAGFIVMAFFCVGLVAITNRRHIKIIFAGTIAGVVGAFAWLYFHEIGRQPIAGTYFPEWLIDPHRQHIWKFAFERFLEKPWFGNGIDQLSKLPGANLSVPGLDSSAAFIPSHPHSWVMEVLSEAGIVGFLPLLFVLSFVAWRLLKRYFREKDEGDLALLALMAGFWSSSLFNFSVWAVWWQLTFFVLFAVISSARPRALPCGNP